LKCKITIIGAGSVAFSLNLVKGLVDTEGLKGSTLALMDINEERLNVVTELARRLMKEKKGDLNLKPYLNRSEALKEADFVINCAEPGGHGTWLKEINIGRKYGLNRARDWFFFMYYQRNMPLLLSIARDIEDLCPNAWLLNYSHPTIFGNWALSRYTKVKNVGLCHATQNGIRKLGVLLDINPEEVQYQAYGVNHFTWLTHFYYRGKDAYPLIDDYLEKRAPEYWESEESQWRQDWHWWGPAKFLSGKRYPELFPEGPVKAELYRIYGLYPLPSDTELLEYFPEFTADDKTIKKFKRGIVEDLLERYIEICATRYADIMRVSKDPSTSVSEAFPWKSTEIAIPIMDSIANNKEKVFIVNIPNRGCIPSLSDEAVIEIPALVSRTGIQGIQVGDLPKGIMDRIKNHLSMSELSMEASMKGDKRTLLQAFLAHPYVESIEQAKEMLDELFKLNEKWLTQFK